MQLVTIRPKSDTYPPFLREIHDPPDPLYVRGQLDLKERVVIAVVGARKCTSYGRQAVKRIVKPLAEAGAVIISGLAFGIDAAAHEAALEAGGTTVAVLGTPINHIYPTTNTRLAERMLAQGGAIVSEIPPGGEIHRGSFPRRNRIIAGLAQATIVVEAAIDSGSLITARSALDENREVLAVPGPITSTISEGTNNLIKIGARPVTDPNDVLAVLGQPLVELGTKKVTISPEEQAILEQLTSHAPVHIDKLASSATIDLPALQSQLTMLELRGLVKMIQPGWYIRL